MENEYPLIVSISLRIRTEYKTILNFQNLGTLQGKKNSTEDKHTQNNENIIISNSEVNTREGKASAFNSIL
jgi:hypothetical protein